MRRALIFLALLVGAEAFALDPKKCFKVTHGDGLLTNYEFPGYLSTEYLHKKYGSTYAPVVSTQQASSAMIDPSVTSGRITSSSQFTSTTGGCSYYSQLKKQREDYYVNNQEFILQAVAMGRGEHLKSMYYYSNCSGNGYNTFRAKLQKLYPALTEGLSVKASLQEIDAMISRSLDLQNSCALSS